MAKTEAIRIINSKISFVNKKLIIYSKRFFFTAGNKLRLIFKTRNAKDALRSLNNTDIDLDEATLWIDENIPLEVVNRLQKEGLDIISQSVIRPGTDDDKVLSEAKKRVIITLDKDFGELIFRMDKSNNGVILLRIHPQSVDYIYEMLKTILYSKIKFETSFCVVEKHRIRIIKLK